MVFFPIVLVCDNEYLKYASVVIASIIKNQNKNCNYEINILSDYISDENKEKVNNQIRKLHNFKIKFITLTNLDTSLFYLNSYMTYSTYYRLYIPELFKSYERILYLDCDLVVDKDISDLVNIDFYEDNEEKLALVCRDLYVMHKLTPQGKDKDLNYHYFKDVLKMQNPEDYFNAGVMVYNLKKINQLNLSKDLFLALQNIKKPIFQDQDILNSVFSNRGGVKHISNMYNHKEGKQHISKIQFLKKMILRKLCLNDNSQYYIYHYMGSSKPWNSRRLNYRLFYFYALYSPFYKEIVRENNNKLWF